LKSNHHLPKILVLAFLSGFFKPTGWAAEDYTYQIQAHQREISDSVDSLNDALKFYHYVTSFKMAIKAEKEILERRWNIAEKQLRAAEWAASQISSEGAQAKTDALSFYSETIKALDPARFGQPQELLVPVGLKRCYLNTHKALYWFTTASMVYGFIYAQKLVNKIFGLDKAILFAPIYAIGAIVYPVMMLIKDRRECRVVSKNAQFTPMAIPTTPGSVGVISFADAMVSEISSNSLKPDFSAVNIVKGAPKGTQLMALELETGFKNLRKNSPKKIRKSLRPLEKKYKKFRRELLKNKNPDKILIKQKELVEEYGKFSVDQKNDLENTWLVRGFWYGLSQSIEALSVQVYAKFNPLTSPKIDPPKNESSKKQNPKVDENLKKKG